MSSLVVINPTRSAFPGVPIPTKSRRIGDSREARQMGRVKKKIEGGKNHSTIRVRHSTVEQEPFRFGHLLPTLHTHSGRRAVHNSLALSFSLSLCVCVGLPSSLSFRRLSLPSLPYTCTGIYQSKKKALPSGSVYGGLTDWSALTGSSNPAVTPIALKVPV